jgi:hypothetical protein
MWSMMPFAERRLAGAGPADDQDVAAQCNSRLDRLALPRRHDSLPFVFLQWKHRGGLAPNRQYRRRHNRRDQGLESGAVEPQLTFENRVLTRDGAAQRAGNGRNEGFRRRGRHRSRRLHRLAKAVDPDRPVGIQHQLDDIRFVQQPAESAELALHAFRKPARLFLAS